MAKTNRETKWALLHGNAKPSRGDSVRLTIITPQSFHGGSFLDKASFTTQVCDLIQVAPNMMCIKDKTTDYYIYNYGQLIASTLCFPHTDGWNLENAPLEGEKLSLCRSTKQTNFQKEFFESNPITLIDEIAPNLIIAWSNDKVLGNDIGYVLNTKVEIASKGLYFWIWQSRIELGKPSTGRITVGLGGESISTDIEFTPKSVSALGNYSLIEAEDGNFYISALPPEYLI